MIHRSASQRNTTYQGRALTHAEIRQSDYRAFHSPLLDSRIETKGPAQLATALRLEFDSSVDCYAIRPRKIAVTDDESVEVFAWVRHASGHENYIVLLPDRNSKNATRLSRFEDRVNRAIATSGLNVSVQQNSKCLERAGDVATLMCLLQWIRLSGSVPEAMDVSRAVLSTVDLLRTPSIKEVIARTASIARSSVLSVVAALLHAGELTPQGTISRSFSMRVARAHACG